MESPDTSGSRDPPVPCGGAPGIQLEILPNTRLIASLGPGIAVSGTQADYALFWDKDIRLAKSLEASGVRLYNSAAAIETCDDKAATHLRLAGQRLPMPRTLVAPMTYRDITDAVEPFCETAENILGYPLVIKECYGSFGGQVFLARDGEELRRLARGREARPFLAQEFIASSAGEDIRLYMVGEECVAAMRRRSAAIFAPISATVEKESAMNLRGRKSGWHPTAAVFWDWISRGWICCTTRREAADLRGQLQCLYGGNHFLHRRGCGGALSVTYCAVNKMAESGGKARLVIKNKGSE